MPPRTWWIVGAGAVSGALAWWYFGRERFDIIDEIGDAIAQLTSTDEMRLAQLQPDAQQAARAMIDHLAQNGLRVKVGQTLRTPAQEKAAIDSGHSAVKTHSWHELARALDVYPYDPDTGALDLDGNNIELFRAIADAGQMFGFRSIAFNADGSKHLITNSAGKKIWDGGHLEYREPYGSIAEAVAAEGAQYGIA